MWQICYSFVKSPLFLAPRILYYAITYEEGFKGDLGGSVLTVLNFHSAITD